MKDGSWNFNKDLFACAAQGRAEGPAIYRDKLLVHELGIDSTPTLFLNGMRVESVTSLADLKEKVDRAVRATSQKLPDQSRD